MTAPPGIVPVLAVVGPTATGKSDLAVAVAIRRGAEVVNADAFQLYRGMDIGTAKLTPAERRGVMHRQVDVLDVTAPASVAAYQRHARADVDAIQRRSAPVVVVGGSGLYVRALLDRLQIPPTDPQVRAAIEQVLRRDGVEEVRRRLAERDPAAAATIDARNGRRLVRALEVVELTGGPFRATLPVREFHRPTVMVALDLPTARHDDVIGDRVQRMWRAGLLAEVTTLVEQGLRRGPTAAAAVGYREALAHLDGTLTAGEAIESTAQATRRLARRQRSWFRADDRIHWLPGDAPDLVDRVLAIWDGQRLTDAGAGAPVGGQSAS